MLFLWVVFLPCLEVDGGHGGMVMLEHPMASCVYLGSCTQLAVLLAHISSDAGRILASACTVVAVACHLQCVASFLSCNRMPAAQVEVMQLYTLKQQVLAFEEYVSSSVRVWAHICDGIWHTTNTAKAFLFPALLRVPCSHVVAVACLHALRPWSQAQAHL